MSSIDQCMVCPEGRDDCELVGINCHEHNICKACLREAVKLAVTDESHYPVSCGGLLCRSIADHEIHTALSTSDEEDANLLERFQAKAEEYSIPPAARVYCANHVCLETLGQSRFINPEVMGEDTAVICPDCSSITCRLCRDPIEGEDHTCKEDDLDATVQAYIDTLPEDEHWLWQKCYSCRSWVNKSEACNHITCRCSAQFCLICGRKWPDGGTSCRHGCPHYAKPVYDDAGFNQFGFHKDTGLDRDGNAHDPNSDLNGDYADDDDDEDDRMFPIYDDEGFDQWGRDRDGFDRLGRDYEGFDRMGLELEGYDFDGFDAQGWDHEGYNRQGYNKSGFDHQGLNNRGMDAEGFFDDGHDMEGFDRDGMSMMNLPKEWYDDDWYDPFGFDVWGYNRAGLDFEDRDIEGYDIEGYDMNARDREGYGRDGYNTLGFDRRGFGRTGYDRRGFNKHHKDAGGNLDRGYVFGADGKSVFVEAKEGPPAEILDCDHRTVFVRGSARCFACKWLSDIFYELCTLCGGKLCRDCDRSGVERQRTKVREQYLWPGSDSYGIEEMFRSVEISESAETVATRPMVERRQSFDGACEERNVTNVGDPGDAFGPV